MSGVPGEWSKLASLANPRGILWEQGRALRRSLLLIRPDKPHATR